MSISLRFFQICHHTLRKTTLTTFMPLSNHFIAKCSTTSDHNIEKVYDRDPAPLFFYPQVQQILETLTKFDLNKVFENRFLEHPDDEQEYKFFTSEDLQEHMNASIQEGKHLLQMPPIVQTREPINELLSYDPALEGLLQNTIIFTDISTGVSDRQRIIVARDPDGTLRQANWDERHRMNQIYNPRPCRYLKVPEVFQSENLKDCLERFEYKFVLDFACAQFEPDDPFYHKVTREIYEHINMRSKHQLLESTRHYGPMCFYLAWHKKIDNLLIQFLHNERLQDCVDLIKLFHLLKTEGSSSTEIKEENYLEYVKNYIENSSQNKSYLDLAIQTYQEAVREKGLLQADK